MDHCSRALWGLYVDFLNIFFRSGPLKQQTWFFWELFFQDTLSNKCGFFTFFPGASEEHPLKGLIWIIKDILFQEPTIIHEIFKDLRTKYEFLRTFFQYTPMKKCGFLEFFVEEPLRNECKFFYLFSKTFRELRVFFKIFPAFCQRINID